MRPPFPGYSAATPQPPGRLPGIKQAVIVLTAGTPIGVAFKGSPNHIKSPTLTAHAIRHAVERAGIEGAEIDDLVIGSVPSPIDTDVIDTGETEESLLALFIVLYCISIQLRLRRKLARSGRVSD